MLERPAQHLHLTMGGTHPKPMSEMPSTHIRPHLVKKDMHLHATSYCEKGSALTSDLILSERRYTYIRPHLVRKALQLHLIMWEHIPQSQQNISTLISDHVGTHPSITSEWLFTDHVVTQPTITSECLCTDHVVT